jgi:ferredoxin
VQHEGKSHELRVESTYTILEAAMDAGISLPYDCKLGVCLTCPAKIVSGIVNQSDGTLDDSVIEQGFALTCVSKPCSDVVIRSIDENELLNAQLVTGPNN